MVRLQQTQCRQDERQTISQLEEYAHKSALENNFENPTALAKTTKNMILLNKIDSKKEEAKEIDILKIDSVYRHSISL